MMCPNRYGGCYIWFLSSGHAFKLGMSSEQDAKPAAWLR